MLKHRLLTSRAVAALLCAVPLLAAAQQTPTLAAIQAQAKQEWSAFKQQFSQHEDLAPAVLAFTPVLRKQAQLYADQIDAAAFKKRYVFPYNSQQSLGTLQQQRFTEFSKLLREGNYYQAQKMMDQIGYDAWNFLRTTAGTNYHLPNDIEVFLNRDIPLAIAKGKAPAKEFYVGYYRGFDNLQIRLVDTELFMEYNDMRDILTLLEKAKNGKISPELTQQIRTIYQGNKWGYSRTFDKTAEDTFKYIARNQKRLYTEPDLLLQCIDQLENTALPKEIKRSLQANLLARGGQLKFSITQANGAFPFDIISLESKLVSNGARSPVLKSLLKSKFLPAIVLLATVGIVSTVQADRLQAQDLKMLQRLQNNFDLFINADQEQLQAIEQNELAAQYCRAQAEALHEVATMSDENASFVADWTARVQGAVQTQAQQTQGRHVKNELLKSLAVQAR